jgi:hypothetical protein
MTFVKPIIKSDINVIVSKPVVKTEKPTRITIKHYERDTFLLNMY